jgi:hypothetical protein
MLLDEAAVTAQFMCKHADSDDSESYKLKGRVHDFQRCRLMLIDNTRRVTLRLSPV